MRVDDKVTLPEPMGTNADIRTEYVPILTVPATEIFLPRQNLSYTLIRKATDSSEASVPIHHITLLYIPECTVLHFNIIPQVKHSSKLSILLCVTVYSVLCIAYKPESE